MAKVAWGRGAVAVTVRQSTVAGAAGLDVGVECKKRQAQELRVGRLNNTFGLGGGGGGTI